MEGRNFLEIAENIGKIIGQPIDPNVPVPPVLQEIFDYETAEPGEEVKIYTTEDTNAGDTIISVGSNGAISNYKVTPQTPAVIPFTSVQSRLERVQVDALLNSPDQSVVARRKAAITRALDKKVTKEALDLILAASSQEVSGSGLDLYDLIMAMKHKIEDYGDNYVLLVGSSVSNAIDVYDKVNATNFHYRVGLVEMLEKKGIKVVKVIGSFNLDDQNSLKVLADDKMILVAKDSTIAKGKPGVYVRRKISPAIAQMMGTEVDNTFRANTVIPLPVNVDGTNTLCFGIHGFEQRVCALLNTRAVAWATL